MAKKKPETVEVVSEGKNTHVMLCQCENEYQDNRYGSHRRVHNRARTKSGAGSAWRCTVCGTLKQ